MGSEEDYIETVLTCEGDFYDPEFHNQLEEFSEQLKRLLTEDSDRQLVLKKVEPWNSVKVTFNIPKDAALRLRQLAEQGDQTLRNLGILSVQIDGDNSISLTLAGKNNETTELVFRTGPPAPPPPPHVASPAAAATASVYDAAEEQVTGPINVESTRKNISQYLGAQGQAAASAALLDIFGSHGPAAAAADGGPSVQIGAHSPSHAAFPSPQLPFSSPSRSPSYHPGVSVGPQVPSSSPHHFMGGHGGPPGISRAPPSYPGQAPHFMAPHQAGYPSPGSQHSPASPKYPTPPPSVSNPNSPGVRHGTAINFPGQHPPHMQQQQQQQQHMVNNMVRLMGNKDITSQSPLLVNLLQNDANAMGNLNNFAQHGRVPFPFDSGAPPQKKKRKPRKPKDSKDVHASGRMDSDQMMVSTIPQQDRVPVSGEPAFAFPSPQHHRQQSATPPSSGGVHYGGQNQMDTKSRLINPFTGQLEVVDDDSNSSVARSDSASSCNTHVDNNVPLSQLQPQPNPLVALHQSKLFSPSASGGNNPAPHSAATMSSPTTSDVMMQAAGPRISQNPSAAAPAPSSHAASADSRIQPSSSSFTPPATSPMFSPTSSSSSHSPSHSIAGLLRSMSNADSDNQTSRESLMEQSGTLHASTSSVSSSPMLSSLASTSSVSHAAPSMFGGNHQHPLASHQQQQQHLRTMSAHLQQQQQHPAYPQPPTGPPQPGSMAGSSLSMISRMVHSQLSAPPAMHAPRPSMAAHGVACSASLTSKAQHQHLQQQQHQVHHPPPPHHPSHHPLHAPSLPPPALHHPPPPQPQHRSTVPSSFPNPAPPLRPPPPRLQLLPPTTSTAVATSAITTSTIGPPPPPPPPPRVPPFDGHQLPPQMDTPPSSTDTLSNPSSDNQSPSSQISPTIIAGTLARVPVVSSSESGASEASRPLPLPAVSEEVQEEEAEAVQSSDHPSSPNSSNTQPAENEPTATATAESKEEEAEEEKQGKEEMETAEREESTVNIPAPSSPGAAEEEPSEQQEEMEQGTSEHPELGTATSGGEEAGTSPSSTLQSSPHVSFAASPDSRISDLDRLGHETPSGKDPDSKESSPTYGGNGNPNGPTSLDSADSGVSMGNNDHKKDDHSAPNGTSGYSENHCDEDADMADETELSSVVHTETSPTHSQESTTTIKQSIPSPLHNNDQEQEQQQHQDNNVSQLKSSNSQGFIPYQNSVLTNHQSPPTSETPTVNHDSETVTTVTENHNGPENSIDTDSQESGKGTPSHSTAPTPVSTTALSKNITVAYAMAGDQQPSRLLKQDITDMVLNTNPKKSTDDLPFLVRPPYSKQAVTEEEGDSKGCRQKQISTGQPGFHSSVDQSLNWMGRSDLNPGGGGKPGKIASLLDLAKPKLNGGDSNVELKLWVGDKFPPEKLHSQNNNKPTTVHSTSDTLLDIKQTLTVCEDKEESSGQNSKTVTLDQAHSEDKDNVDNTTQKQNSLNDDELSTPPLSEAEMDVEEEEEEEEGGCDVCSKDTSASAAATSMTPTSAAVTSVPAPETTLPQAHVPVETPAVASTSSSAPEKQPAESTPVEEVTVAGSPPMPTTETDVLMENKSESEPMDMTTEPKDSEERSTEVLEQSQTDPTKTEDNVKVDSKEEESEKDGTVSCTEVLEVAKVDAKTEQDTDIVDSSEQLSDVDGHNEGTQSDKADDQNSEDKDNKSSEPSNNEVKSEEKSEQALKPNSPVHETEALNSIKDESAKSEDSNSNDINEPSDNAKCTCNSDSETKAVVASSNAEHNSEETNHSLPEDSVVSQASTSSSSQVSPTSTIVNPIPNYTKATTSSQLLTTVPNSIVSPSFSVAVTTVVNSSTAAGLFLSQSGPKPVMSSSISASARSSLHGLKPLRSTEASADIIVSRSSNLVHSQYIPEQPARAGFTTMGSIMNHAVLQHMFHHTPGGGGGAGKSDVLLSMPHQITPPYGSYAAIQMAANRKSPLHIDTSPVSVQASVSPAATSRIVAPIAGEVADKKRKSPIMASPVIPVTKLSPHLVKMPSLNVSLIAKEKKETCANVPKPAALKATTDPIVVAEDRGQRSRTQTPELCHVELAMEKAKSSGGMTKGISILKPLYDKEAFFDDEIDMSQAGKTEVAVEETVVTEVETTSAAKQAPKKPQGTVAQLLQDAEKKPSPAQVSPSLSQPIQSTSTVNQAVVTTSNSLQITQAPSINPAVNLSVTSAAALSATQYVTTSVVSTVQAPIASVVSAPMYRAPVTLINAMSKLQAPVLSSLPPAASTPALVRGAVTVALRNKTPASIPVQLPPQLRHTVQNLLAKPTVTSCEQVKTVTTPAAKVTASPSAPITSTPEQLAQSIIKVAQEREKAAEKAKSAAKKPHVTTTVTSFASPGNAAHLSNFVQKSLNTPTKVNAASLHHPIMAPGFHLNLTESVQKVMKPIPSSDSTPPPSPKTSKTLQSQAVLNPTKVVKLPYASAVTSRGASPVRLPENLCELKSVLDSKTSSINKPVQLNHALSPVTVLSRQKTPSPQPPPPAISPLNVSSAANTYHRVVSPGGANNPRMSPTVIHSSPQRISPSLSRTPSPRASQLSPSRNPSNYHVSPPRSVPSPHIENRKSPSPASSTVAPKIPTPPLLMRASPSKVAPNVIPLASCSNSLDVLTPATTVITLRSTGVTGLVGEHSYSAKPVLVSQPTNVDINTAEGNAVEVLPAKQVEPLCKPRVLDLSSAVEVKKPDFGSKIHSVGAILVAKAVAADQEKKSVLVTASSAPVTVVVTTSPIGNTSTLSVSKPQQPVTRHQAAAKPKVEPNVPKVSAPSEFPVSLVATADCDVSPEEAGSPVHIVHPVSKTYSKTMYTTKPAVMRNSVDRDVTPPEAPPTQEEATASKPEAVKTRASKRKASESIAPDEPEGPSKPTKMLRSSTEPAKEEEQNSAKPPARIGRRNSRESTESRASSADSKMDKEATKLNLTSTRSRKKSLSECSDTSSIAEESSGSRTRRGLRAPSERSESPAPRSSARLSTRSSARRRQTEDSASPTKQTPTPTHSPTPPPQTPDSSAPAEKPATRQNRNKRKHASGEEEVPEKKAKEEAGTEEKTKTEPVPKAKRSTSPMKTEEVLNSKMAKGNPKSKTQPKGKEDHQSQDAEKRNQGKAAGGGSSGEPPTSTVPQQQQPQQQQHAEETPVATDGGGETADAASHGTRRSTRSTRAIKDHGDMVAMPSLKRRR